MRLFWGNKFGYLAISLYLCIVKISEGMSARTRKNYFSRALGNSATCGSELTSDIKD